MNDPLHVKEDERGIVRVFALSAPLAKQLSDEDSLSGLEAALKTLLNATDVQIVKKGDLTGFGFSTLLNEGYDVELTSVQKREIDAYEDDAAILRSATFTGKPVQLMPSADAALLGVFRERTAPPPRFDPLPAEGAKPSGNSRPARSSFKYRVGTWPFLLVLGIVIAVIIFALG